MAKRVDANQAAIVEALRAAGCSVQSLAELGRGVPDLLVCAPLRPWKRLLPGMPRDETELFLLEVKSPKGQLTSDEIAWHNSWQGPVYIVRSVAHALTACGINAERIDPMARHVAQTGQGGTARGAGVGTGRTAHSRGLFRGNGAAG